MANLVSLTMDDLIAFQTLKNLFGHALVTPNLDRLVGLGVSFENAFAQVAICNPSRTSVLTGLRPESTGVHSNSQKWTDFVSPAETLPVFLHNAGFETSVVGKVYHEASASLQSLPEMDGITLISDTSYWIGTTLPFRSGVLHVPAEAHGDYINTSAAVQIIQGWDDASSNALFLGIFRPHGDFTAPQEFFDLYPTSDIALPVNPNNDIDDLPDYIRGLLSNWGVSTTEDWTSVLQAYFASISFADAQVGRVLDALEAGGHMADTTIVLWSDHGYHLGDKDTWHKFTLWDEAGRAPLIIYDPDRGTAGHKVQTTVELLDIAPTILDLLGLTPSWELEGTSLADLLNAANTRPDGQAITTMYGSVSIRTDTYRFIKYEDGSEELYNIVADPNQIVNLTTDPFYGSIKAELNVRLLAQMESSGWRFVESDSNFSTVVSDLTVVVRPDAVSVIGGSGDDTYFLPNLPGVIFEADDGGTDTVYLWSSYILPSGIENAIARDEHAYRRIQIVGNAEDNHIIGGTNLEGMDGDDRLKLIFIGKADGGNGNDNIEGSQFNDALSGGAGDDYVNGGAGNDLITGGDGADRLYGANGDDLLRPGAGNDFVSGNAGTNTLDLSDLHANTHVDIAARRAISELGQIRFAGIQNIVATDYHDAVFGDDFSNHIYGLDGDDGLYGGGGNDLVDGGLGDDSLIGGDGDDTASGGAGSDIIDGGAGTDILHGGAGNDTLSDGGGIGNALHGEEDDDTLSADNGSGILSGGSGNDRLGAADGIYTLLGEEGNDTLAIGGGSYASAAEDGIQTATGGAGADLFHVHTSSTFGHSDIITDFSSADGDLVQLDQVSAGRSTPDGYWPLSNGLLVFRGSMEPSLFALGAALPGDDIGAGLIQFWTVQTGDYTYLVGDSDGDLVLDETDLVVRFEGTISLSAAAFAAGTFVALAGTPANDSLLGSDTAADQIFGATGDDALYGLDGDDGLYGGGGNDLVDGGLGDDSLIGGDGDDTASGGAGSDIIDGGAGTDILHGGAGNDTLSDGGGIGNALHGEEDDDTLSADNGSGILSGGSGNDRLGAADGIYTLLGEEGNDTLAIGGGSYASAAEDGIQTATGGAGADLFHVHTSSTFGHSDIITDFSSADGDLVQLDQVSAGRSTPDGYWPLSNGLLVFRGSMEPSLFALGAALPGDDIGAGLIQFWTVQTGDYTYLVGDSDGDLVLDETDLVVRFEGTISLSAAAFAAGTFVALAGTPANDSLLGSDTAADQIFGATGDDALYGLDGDDGLYGGGGNDLVDGGLGDDSLIGGDGADILRGGLGDDSYLVDQTGDHVQEGANAGTDTVRAAINYALTNNVENLVLEGTAHLNGIGNALANVLTGNVGNNYLHGGGGADTLRGLAGNDIYHVDNADDVVMEDLDAGTDTVIAAISYTLSENVENLAFIGTTDLNGAGNALANVLTGNTGNNVLDGGIGADILRGGLGDDSYLVDQTGDHVQEGANAGTDTVRAGINYALINNNVENLVLEGSADLNGFGNALANVLTGNVGNNYLYGGGGADTLRGLAGNDIYHVDNADDVVMEDLDAGTDTVIAAISYTLSENVENLAFIGTTDLNGAGNALANVLTGNTGNNVLDGGIGADILRGGLGDDSYLVDQTGDHVQEGANAGTDTVRAAINYALINNNVENLVLEGSADLNGFGNALANVLTGNVGNNYLYGGGGADTLRGLAGNDIYHVDNADDVVMEDLDGGTDTVVAAISYTLSENVENLAFIGTTDLNGAGNALANVLTGNTGNNVLDGGIGADILRGGAGSDLLTGGSGGDLMYGGNDTVTDMFIFHNIMDCMPGAERDRLFDFSSGIDQIDFSAIDANSSSDGDQTFAFSTIGPAAHSVWVVDIGLHLLVRGDTTGDLGADFELQIMNSEQVLASDFVL